MTRRTPEPGDSFTKGGSTLTIVRVTQRSVYMLRERDKTEHRMSIREFHEAVAYETWGRP